MTSPITLREYVFKEAEWQIFGLILNGFSSALGNFASFYCFNALNSNPARTSDDMTNFF